MKNTIRVRKNRSASRPTPQAKILDGEISLLLWDNREGIEIAGIDLTGEEFTQLRRRAAELKTSLPHLLCEGVRQMLKTRKIKAVLGPCLQPRAGGAK